MRNSKKITVNEPIAEHAAVDPELESRVDSLMALEPAEIAKNNAREEAAAITATDLVVEKKSTQAPIDIFNDPKTAPVVPPELAKTMSVADESVAVNTPQKLVPNNDIAPEKSLETATVADALEEAETNKAIDDITRKEADDLLKMQDETVAKAPVLKPRSRWKRFWQGFAALWAFGWVRFIVFLLVLAGIAALVAWPTSRYYALNAVGVRSGASLTVVDETTGMALKNAEVRIGEFSETTDTEGTVTFCELKLGEHELVIERVAYAPLKRTITLGWGSNPLGDIELQSTGVQYAFVVTDFISGKPIVDAEASFGDATAVSNKEGEIALSVDDVSGETIEITISSANYRTEVVEVSIDQDEPLVVQLVAASPVVYVAKSGESLNLYKIDVDGKNKKLLLADLGGSDGRDIQLLVDGASRRAAIVSKRNTARTTASGDVLDAITIVDIANRTENIIDYAERAHLVAWGGNRIVYNATYQTPADQAVSEERLVSYDVEESARSALFTAGTFRGVVAARGYVYVAYTATDKTAGLLRLKSDGSDKKILLKNEAWSLVRSDANELSFQTSEGKQKINLGNLSISASDVIASHVAYVDGTNDRTIRIDDRSGTPALVLHTYKTGQDSVVVTKNGLTNPIRWLNSTTVAVSVATDSESALYAVHLAGDKAIKVVDGIQTTLGN